MNSFRDVARALAVPMAAVMLVTSVPIGAARAGMIPTDQVIAGQAAESARARVQAFMARDDVRSALVRLGVDPTEATARIAGLSDAEVGDIAGRIDQLPAGQDFFGAVLGAALVIFLVLLITDILGLTDVFPFVRH